MILRYACTAAIACGAISLVAQPTLTAATHVPAPPLDVPVITSNFFQGPGPSGTDVPYTYWTMLAPSTGTKTIYYRAASITPTAAAIPTATYLTTDGGSDTTFWASTSQGLEQVGVRTNLEGIINFSDASLELELPCTFGTSWSDPTGASYLVSGIVPVTRVGTVTGIADAYGSLALPQGGMQPTILRVKVRRDISDNSAVANVHRIANIHYYYAPTLPHPILTLTEDSVQIGTGAWTVARNAAWQGATFIVGMDEPVNEDVVFTAFPNPAVDLLNVRFEEGATSNTRVEFLDGLGRVVLTSAVVSGSASVDTRSLANGLYTLRVLAGDRVLGTTRITVQ